MELVDVFKQLALDAEGRMHGLANRRLSNAERREALNKLKAKFEAMAEDGYIDPQELEELLRSLSAEGLDSQSLAALYDQLKASDSTVRAEDGSKFEEAFDDMMDEALRQAQDNEADTAFEIQVAVSDASHYADAAGKLLTAEHKVYMNLIANMKA